MKYIIAIIIIIIIGLWAGMTTAFITGIESEKEKMKCYLGNKYVLNGDTLIVIDYSILDETLTLSNGSVINAGLLTPKE